MSRFELRDYQKQALASIPEAGAYLICMATGLGKTVTFSQIPRRGRMLILSHRDELVHQPQKYFDCSFGVEQAKETSHGEEVISASVQSLLRRLDKFKADDFDIIIVDEAHHCVAPTYREIISYFTPRLLLGFTATPNRNDKIGLNNIFNDIIFERNLRWGIEHGYLSNIYCLRVNIYYDLQGVAKRLGDYAPGELDMRVNIEKANKAIAEAYKLYAKPPCLIFCTSVAHAQALAELIPDAVAVKGGEDRSDIVKKFSNGDIPCITNCMVFTEGTDLPNINSIIIARPTQNKSLFCQMVGRGLRLYPGKEHLTLIDCVGLSEDDNLCTAPSLLGLDIKNVPLRMRDKIQGNLFDLPELINEASDCPDSWILNVKHVQLWSELSHYNTHGINFIKHSDGSMSIMDIYIPPENQLGMIKWHDAIVDTQQVLDEVYATLKRDYGDQRALWDLSLMKKWGMAGATDRQKELIKARFADYPVENLTKFEANQILGQMYRPEPVTLKQAYILRKFGVPLNGMTKQKAKKIIGELMKSA